MTATYTEPVLNYTIPLNFRHRLSTVEVRIERNEGVREAAIENVKRTSRSTCLPVKSLRTKAGETAGCTDIPSREMPQRYSA